VIDGPEETSDVLPLDRGRPVRSARARVIWWLLDPARWGTAFPEPLFGLIGWLVVPWTTIAYLFTFPGGIEGLDWGLILLGLVVDLGTNGGGIFGRDRRVRWQAR
jgi:hypothetical protein